MSTRNPIFISFRVKGHGRNLFGTTRRCSAIFALAIAFNIVPWANNSFAASPPDAPWLNQVLELAGRPQSVVLLPDPRDADLGLSLATTSSAYIVAQTSDAKAQQELRFTADKEGLLCRRISVLEGDPQHPSLADRTANAIVLTQATDEDLARWDARRLWRVLAPPRGRLVVGKRHTAPGTLTREGLEAWAKKGCPDAVSRIHSDNAGLWLVIERGAVAKSDEWRYRMHGADNNPASTDTAFKWPPMTQWLGKPYVWGASTYLVANGRSFTIYERKQASISDRNNGDGAETAGGEIVARDVNSGQILWRRDTPLDYSADSGLSTAVALDDAFVMLDPAGSSIMFLDPDTGREIRRMDCSAMGAQAKWLAVENGRVYALVGDRDPFARAGGTWNWSNPFGAISRVHGPHLNAQGKPVKAKPDDVGLGRTLAAFDLKSGALLWKYQATEPIYEYQIGMSSDHLYAIEEGAGMIALNLRDGSILWRNAEILKPLNDWAAAFRLHASGEAGGILVTPDILLVSRPYNGIVAISSKDGSMLWNLSKKKIPNMHPVIRGDQIFGRIGQNTVLDLRSGAPLTKGPINYTTNCGMMTLSPEFICAQWGISQFLDSPSGVGVPLSTDVGALNHKGSCSSGSRVAEGLFHHTSAGCLCPIGVRGWVTECGAGDFVFGQKAIEGERLRRTPGYDRVQPLAESAGDWLTERANQRRSNAVDTPVAATAHALWHQPLPKPYTNPVLPSRSVQTEYEPTPNVIQDGLIFSGGPEGAVRCRSLADGALRWTFYTGARLYAAPALWQGRVLAGSGDGWIYCLEARTGRELWRFRAAPVDRFLFAYGHLVNSWPLTGGVVTDQGIAYAAACLVSVNGAHVYALDAVSGAIRWQNNDSGISDPVSRAGVAPVGVPAIGAGRLWYRGNSYDLKTGVCKAVGSDVHMNGVKGWRVDPSLTTCERLTGVLSEDRLCWGGRSIYSDHQVGFSDFRLGNTYMPRMSHDGGAETPEVNRRKTLCGALNGLRNLPAWDERLFVLAPWETSAAKTDLKGPFCGSLVAVDKPRFLQALDALEEKPVSKDTTIFRMKQAEDDGGADQEPAEKQPPKKEEGKSAKTLANEKKEASRTALPEQWRFALPQAQIWGIVLTRNAVVAAVTIPPGNFIGPVAANRNTKETRANVRAYGPPVKWQSQVLAVDREDGRLLWTCDLPSQPLSDGIAVAPDGAITVQLLDGGLCAVGAGTQGSLK